MKKVGIIGGSFNPVHFGHINLALSLLEKRGLDEVWWIPAQNNPLKSPLEILGRDRFNMVKLAVESIKNFKVMDLEIAKAETSFTIDTLKELKVLFPDIQMHFLMGDDLVKEVLKWKSFEEIALIASPLVGAREDKIPDFSHLEGNIKRSLEEGWTQIPKLEISASEIRKRLKLHLFCEHLLPLKVLDYIHQHQLY